MSFQDMHESLRSVEQKSEEMLDQVAALVDEFAIRWSERADSIVERCRGIENTTEDMSIDLTDLQLSADEFLEHLEIGAEQCKERWKSLYAQFDDKVNAKRERLEELGERAIEMIEGEWEEIGVEANAWKESAINSLKEYWTDHLDELMSGTEEKLRDTFSKKLEELSGYGRHFKESVEDSLADLQSYIEDDLRSRIERQGEETVHEVLERLAEEFLESTMLSQFQVQITTALTPYLPQLIAIRVLAPSIRQALEAMRAGL